MATEKDRRTATAMFDFALSLFGAAEYQRCEVHGTCGLEWAEAVLHRSAVQYFRHIRPAGGGFPQCAFLITEMRVWFVMKEARDANWVQASSVQSTSRDVDHHRAGASCPGQTERTVHCLN